MKKAKIVTIVMALVLIFAMVTPASAQLGDTNSSTFTVQNISTQTATVSVMFVSETGVSYTPTQLDGNTPTGFPNPFQLASGASRQIIVAQIPAGQLPPNRYSVVISSDVQVAAVAGLAGDGTRRFSGGYSGFASGSSTVYLATTAFNYSGWYSMISVQNVGSAPANVTVTITCSDGLVGTLSRNGIPAMASYTWALKNTTPSGFNSVTTHCIGSSVVTANQNIVAVNVQNVPAGGQTNSFEGSSSGHSKVYVSNLSKDFSGWNSALNIRKLGSGNTTVTIDYSDAEPNDTCNLTDAVPSCQLYIPSFHTIPGRFSATITASPAMQLLAVVGTSHTSGLSGAVVGVGGGSASVAIPNVAKYYFNWRSAVNCQNVGTTPTTLNFSYQGYPPYNHPTTLNEGESIQVLAANEAFLPNGYIGGLTVTANAVGANVACTVGNTNSFNQGITPGDWTTQFNAFPRP